MNDCHVDKDDRFGVKYHDNDSLDLEMLFKHTQDRLDKQRYFCLHYSQMLKKKATKRIANYVKDGTFRLQDEKMRAVKELATSQQLVWRYAMSVFGGHYEKLYYYGGYFDNDCIEPFDGLLSANWLTAFHETYIDDPRFKPVPEYDSYLFNVILKHT